MIKDEKVEEVLTRSVENINPSSEEFKEALLSGKKLKIYIGVDATGPHLHLGHLTNFLWLKRIQELGHEIILLIGDFTGWVGDPTDKVAPRQSLTEEQIKKNMRTFEKQVSPIISFSGKNPARIRFNSEWYREMKLEKFITDLLGFFSVQNLLHRPGFKERIEKDRLRLQEFIYPLLQGYDGVALDVDVEVGGNDQTFNMSIGRALRKAHSKRSDGKVRKGEKFFVATTLLVNPKTGKKLMNKSEGGFINLDDSPQEIFGKVMALNDDSMLAVAEHCTFLSLKHIEDLRRGIASSRINPRDAKLEIAAAVVEVIYKKNESERARKNWESIFSKKGAPADLPALALDGVMQQFSDDLVMKSGVIGSRSVAWRLIEQGGFEVNRKKVRDPRERNTLKDGDILRIGKKNFFRIKAWG